MVSSSQGEGMSDSAWSRVSGAMGIPFAIAFVLGLALSGNSPDDTSSDQTIMDYYASHSHRVVRCQPTFAVSATYVVLHIRDEGKEHRITAHRKERALPRVYPISWIYGKRRSGDCGRRRT
jgi:hypothetical protein